MKKKYYITNLYGLDKDFVIDEEDITNCIEKATKKDYGQIIVKKSFKGFREIITGKKIEELDIVHKYKDYYYHCYLDIKVPDKFMFIIVESHFEYDINNSISIRLANDDEIQDYLIKYKNRKFELLDYLNKIEETTNNYYDNAINNYNNVNIRVLKK